MVDEILLKKEIDLYKISGITIKGILQLCELFVVPYRTMAKRLREIELISEHELEKFLSESEESINKYRKIYSFVLRDPDERVVMDNLVELSDLTPEDLGMEKKSDYEFPSAVQQLSKLISENKVVLVNESSLNSKDRAIYDAAYKNLEKVSIDDITCIRIVDIIIKARDGEVDVPCKVAKALWLIAGKNKDIFDTEIWPVKVE